MNTFLITIDNLGPIKSTTFTASHFNVLCGKNNSGKTICLHTMFCFFKYWRSKIHLEAEPALVDDLMNGEVVSFDMGTYFKKYNGALKKSMGRFVEMLPNFLNRNPEQFKDCSIDIKVSNEYLKYISSRPIRVRSTMSSSYVMRIRKDENTLVSTVWIEGSKEDNAPYPDKSAIYSTLNGLLSFALFDCLLPKPYLLTAERSGSIMYGDGLRTSKFIASQEQNSNDSGQPDEGIRYAKPYIAELEEIWSAQAAPAGKRDLDDNLAIGEILETFNTKVAGGSYTNKDNHFYYTQKNNGKIVLIQEASTSVRALTQLSCFIERVADESGLLMIDEPELNLHPERQRALTRLLAMMASQLGVGVVMSTHSDIIVRELNTLLVFGSNPSKYFALMKEFNYSSKEVLSPSDVACGVVDAGGITQLSLEGARGFAVSSFDATYDDINRVQEAIVSQWESQDEEAR